MNKHILQTIICLLVVLALGACKSDPPPVKEDDKKVKTPIKKKPTAKVPRFNRDSAYAYVEKQVAFGPRVPNSAAHTACKNWLVSKFKSFGATVIEDDFEAKGYTGVIYKATNVIAQYNPEHAKRILLAAHWDTRFIGDYDKDTAKQKDPIPGADDGGSGVGVLLEIARLLGENNIDMGVDIVLFDVEDQGEGSGLETTWCLGAQHWAKNPHVAGYRAEFGILLDMVGSKGARFTREGLSMQVAPQVMNKMWKLAKNMGYGNYFVMDQTRQIIDDHYFVNKYSKTKMIDVINRPANTQTGFGHYWHTHDDDMDVINKTTLRAVGQTVLAVLYRSSDGRF